MSPNKFCLVRLHTFDNLFIWRAAVYYALCMHCVVESQYLSLFSVGSLHFLQPQFHPQLQTVDATMLIVQPQMLDLCTSGSLNTISYWIHYQPRSTVLLDFELVIIPANFWKQWLSFQTADRFCILRTWVDFWFSYDAKFTPTWNLVYSINADGRLRWAWQIFATYSTQK